MTLEEEQKALQADRKELQEKIGSIDNRIEAIPGETSQLAA